MISKRLVKENEKAEIFLLLEGENKEYFKRKTFFI
jgi:hypothetical protein